MAPRILLLQILNMLMGGGCYLIAVSSFGVWSAAGWSPVRTGGAMMAANLAYGALVGLGGKMADSWGRARTAVCGALIATAGGLLAWLVADPWAAAIGTVVCFGGSALFFPGNVGLFSDARTDGGGEVALHVKVSRYNLGWSGGNLAGFVIAWLLSFGHVTAGYLVAVGGFVLITATQLQWWSLPPQPPAASGDRGDHPALPRLIRMGRVGLMLYCLMGMALISLFENTLARTAPPAAAHTTATAALAIYALGYFAMFGVLGWWSGWVMRPWRLFAIAALLPLAAGGFLACGLLGSTGPVPYALCSLVLGIAFAAVYTASMYYSLRLPHGAARAASLHETYLGVGSTLGPVLCGGFLMLWSDGVTGLGVYLLIGSALVLGWQLSQLPGISRILAEKDPTSAP
jgi:MFS family permease